MFLSVLYDMNVDLNLYGTPKVVYWKWQTFELLKPGSHYILLFVSVPFSYCGLGLFLCDFIFIMYTYVRVETVIW